MTRRRQYRGHAIVATLVTFIGISAVKAEATVPVVRPFVTCVTRGPNTVTVSFGYDNPGSGSIKIPLGRRNNLTPTGTTKPPTVFTPGRVLVAFNSTFAGNAKPIWVVKSGTTAVVARVLTTTSSCGTPPPSTTAEGPTHGLTLVLDGKTTVFRYPVTTRPQKLDGQSHVMVAGYQRDQQAWSLLSGGGGLQVQFGSEKGIPLQVGTYQLGACPAGCADDAAGYTAVATDGSPSTTLLAYDFPSLNLKPVTLTITSVDEATFPSEDGSAAPVPFRYVKGTIEGRVATVAFGESPAIVRGPFDIKVTFDIWFEELKR
jgi:hypothetical protein